MFDYHCLGHHTFDASFNLAMEEALYRKSSEENKAFLRFYSFPRDSIVYGYSQKTDKLINGSLPYTRRMTGGTHIQVGPNTLAYSVIVPNPNENFGYLEMEKMRAYYANRVARAFDELGLRHLDVDNNASTINFNDKVVASHAMFWGLKSAVFHGLVIINPYDAETMKQNIRLGYREINGKQYTEYSALKNIPALSSIDKGIWQEEENPTTSIIKRFVCSAIARQVMETYHSPYPIENITLNPSVLAEAQNLLTTKYNTNEWLHWRDPVFTTEKDLVQSIPGEELSGPLKLNQPYCMWLQVPDHKFKKMADPELINH